MRSALPKSHGDDPTRITSPSATIASLLRRPPGVQITNERRPPVSRLSAPRMELPAQSRIVLRPPKTLR